MTEFNPARQLSLVDEMILSTRKDFKDNGFQYLYWGWLVFIADIGHYLLIKLNIPHPYAAWFIMPIGAIVGIFLIRKEVKEARVTTWLDRMMKYIWTSFGVCLLIVLGFGFKLQINTFPMVLIVYGMGTFLSGGALGFKPLIAGGILCWVLSVACFFAPPETQLLILAASLLGAYIIPGYILKKRYNDVQ
jgi:hypothetical protein